MAEKIEPNSPTALTTAARGNLVSIAGLYFVVVVVLPGYVVTSCECAICITYDLSVRRVWNGIRLGVYKFDSFCGTR
jgi:hypothetical protein